MGVLQSSHETLRQAGIKPDQIRLVMNDTKITPNSGPAGGSRSQVMSGNACRLGAENLLAAMTAVPTLNSKLVTLLNDAEDSLGYPLVSRNKDGPSGPGTLLTEKGSRLLSAYDQFESQARENIEQLHDLYLRNIL